MTFLLSLQRSFFSRGEEKAFASDFECLNTFRAEWFMERHKAPLPDVRTRRYYQAQHPLDLKLNLHVWL